MSLNQGQDSSLNVPTLGNGYGVSLGIRYGINSKFPVSKVSSIIVKK